MVSWWRHRGFTVRESYLQPQTTLHRRFLLEFSTVVWLRSDRWVFQLLRLIGPMWQLSIKPWFRPNLWATQKRWSDSAPGHSLQGVIRVVHPTNPPKRFLYYPDHFLFSLHQSWIYLSHAFHNRMSTSWWVFPMTRGQELFRLLFYGELYVHIYQKSVAMKQPVSVSQNCTRRLLSPSLYLLSIIHAAHNISNAYDQLLHFFKSCLSASQH